MKEDKIKRHKHRMHAPYTASSTAQYGRLTRLFNEYLGNLDKSKPDEYLRKVVLKALLSDRSKNVVTEEDRSLLSHLEQIEDYSKLRLDLVSKNNIDGEAFASFNTFELLMYYQNHFSIIKNEATLTKILEAGFKQGLEYKVLDNKELKELYVRVASTIDTENSKARIKHNSC